MTPITVPTLYILFFMVFGAIGRLEIPGDGSTVWFTRTFPRNQDATLKQMSALTFIRFFKLLKYLIDPTSK